MKLTKFLIIKFTGVRKCSYVGLTKHWAQPIVCSTITKRLATTFIGLKGDLFTTLDTGKSRVVGGWELTAVDANQCPGRLTAELAMEWRRRQCSGIPR